MAATNLAAAVLADSPSGYWKLEDAAGSSSVADASGVAGAGTPQAGIRLGYPCPWGTCAWFDGSTSAYVTLPVNQGFSAAGLTFEALLATDATDSQQRIVDFQNSASSNAGVYVTAHSTQNNGSPGAVANAGATIASTNPPPTYGVFVHYVVTISSAGAVSWYLNAVAKGTGTTGSPATSGTRANCYIGRSSFPADPYLQGLLGHVAWYPTVLTSTRVTAHYNAWQADLSTMSAAGLWDYSTRVAGASHTPTAFLYKGRDTALADAGSSP